MTHAIEHAPSPTTDPRPRGAATSPTAIGRVATWLAASAGALALTATLAGLLVDDVYAGDVSTAEMFRGFDLVTAMAVVPGLAWAMHLARNGSARARLIVTGLLAYLIYTYAYYLFGTGFNDLFLLHVAVFAAALPAFTLSLVTADAGPAAERSGSRVIAGILGALAVALGGMWVYLAASNAATGGVPAGSRLVETDTVVHLGMALDLSLLVPLYATTAVLLWRRMRWGSVLAAVALVAGLLHQVDYIVAMPFQVAADVPGAVPYDPAEPVIVLLYLVATALLFRRGGRPRPGRGW
ncbi:hypothetical protein [Nucisporomicrobium flavum]|uniref:hypothetical protein n=1 Tax=Nucisporomicrobium flavum TaxID=2785915 RepID=UPI0018F79BEA|nr:hypothetical protein [Nucisporomicrobium flavum]